MPFQGSMSHEDNAFCTHSQHDHFAAVCFAWPLRVIAYVRACGKMIPGNQMPLRQGNKAQE